MKKYAISCLGCKVNSTEAEGIRETLNNGEYEEVDFREYADIYLIITCAVTNVASAKSRKKINQAIRQNKDAVIGVIGCYVQVSLDEIKKSEHIDILVGSSNKNQIPKLIEEVIKTKERQVLVDDVRENATFESLDISHYEHKTRAYLKIQDGCNQFCSYCIIPYARGKERSLPLDEVINNAKKLSLKHKEIVLTGIHTGRYKDNNSSLSLCIKRIINEVQGLQRLRISSIEVSEIDDDLIDMLSKDNILAKHLHIPLQSGCDKILKMMNRPYTTEEFFNKIEEIRKKIPDISISTDLIVGFPQESDEDFNETLNFLKKCRFSFLHVFPFSLKDKTVATSLNNQNSNEIKRLRVKEATKISDDLYKEYQEKFIGKKLDVLVEKYDDQYSFGHSSEYIPVYVNGKFDNNNIVGVIGSLIKDGNIYAEVELEE
ncbi:MAG: tRNA (N(6)-L-threonylcarbamoyladenosine(37)-C(2))-methylthiotransferase MtaB [Anaerorhabdus sp.]